MIEANLSNQFGWNSVSRRDDLQFRGGPTDEHSSTRRAFDVDTKLEVGPAIKF